MTDLSLYSQLKPAWHLDRLAALRAGRPLPPVHVQLILSDLCNQDCAFCAYRISSGLSSELFVTPTTHNPNRRIPTNKALEIVEDCAELGVKAIQFTGGGEPTVHPDHLLIFSRAQSLGLETALVTNGVQLDGLHPAVLGMTWIRVSVDAGMPEVYAAVRRAPVRHWRTVWRNIEGLGRHYQGALGVGFVVTPENWRGVVECARLAREAGANNIRVGAVFTAQGAGYYDAASPTLIAEVEALIAQAKAAYETPTFAVIDQFSRRIADLHEGHPSDPACHYQHFTMYIGGDLNVYRCCNTAYTTAGKVGSLAAARLRDMPFTYAPFDARGCQHCQFLGQNRAIASLLQRPAHANFV